MGWISRSWRGEEELWKVVWINGAFLVFLGQVALVALRLFTSAGFDNPGEAQSLFLVWLQRLYCLWMVVSLWRCAFTADWKIWGYFVRPVVIVFVLVYGFIIYSEGKMMEPKVILTRAGTLVQKQAPGWIRKFHTLTGK